MTPVEAVRLVPGGIAPLRIVHVYGEVPPLIVIDCVKVEPIVLPLWLPQLAVKEAEMTIEQEIGDATFPRLSVAVRLKVYVAAAVGTPETTPDAGLSVSPVGRLPDVTAHVTPPIPPVEVKVCV